MCIRLLISGALGHMGKVLTDLIQSQPEQFSLAGGVDQKHGAYPAPLFGSPSEIAVPFDVAIDFSAPAAAIALLDECVKRNRPVLIATTGFDAEGIAKISAAAKVIPVFYTGNLSIGVNLQIALIQKAASVLGDSFDVEIIETHHNLKKDAPSGTALMLEKAVAGSLPHPSEPMFGRHGKDCKRSPSEIGIHSVRGGTICGEHAVRFIGTDEELIVEHKAYSKAVFAKGALKAAAFLSGVSAPGLYDMSDII